MLQMMIWKDAPVQVCAAGGSSIRCDSGAKRGREYIYTGNWGWVRGRESDSWKGAANDVSLEGGKTVITDQDGERCLSSYAITRMPCLSPRYILFSLNQVRTGDGPQPLLCAAMPPSSAANLFIVLPMSTRRQFIRHHIFIATTP